MIVDPVLVSLVSAATALVASITGPFITLYVGRAQIKVAVLSTNRQKWIDGFRELVATFCSQVAAIVQVRDKIITEGKINLTGDAALLHQFERLIFTVTKIKLMINPRSLKAGVREAPSPESQSDYGRGPILSRYSAMTSALPAEQAI